VAVLAHRVIGGGHPTVEVRPGLLGQIPLTELTWKPEPPQEVWVRSVLLVRDDTVS
jgi:hypothetical protein